MLLLIVTLLYFLALLISVLYMSPIIAFVFNFFFFLAIVIFFRAILHSNFCKKNCNKLNTYKEKSDESTITITKLKNDLIKATVIDKIQTEKNQIKDELVRTTSYNHHLSGVISGLNHELSPWISGIYLIANRLYEDELDEENKKSLLNIMNASTHTEELLLTLSKSVNKLKNFSVFKSNVKDTVASWIQLVLLERTIKEKISHENIIVDLESLDFEAEHSSMFLSQIILNLAKNSIDHNSHMLDNLKIKIYGIASRKCLIYEDNGKGIPPNILSKVFNNVGITTKTSDSGEIHGFGLYSCLNYCLSMKSTIQAKSILNNSTQFIIKFERINENNEIETATTGF